MTSPDPAAAPAARIPLWVKPFYTAFVAVLVPAYWQRYGPTNFLYFCDVALLLTVPALWLEDALLASACLVGIFIPQLLWQIDFVVEATGGKFTGLTGYMFNTEKPWFPRFLSFFHFWLPLFLLWVVWRLGYDRRALVLWTVLAWALMLICWLWMPAPGAEADPDMPVNINYVWGFDPDKPQQWMSPPLYLAVLMVVLPVGIFGPTHWLLKRYWPAARSSS